MRREIEDGLSITKSEKTRIGKEKGIGETLLVVPLLPVTEGGGNG